MLRFDLFLLVALSAFPCCFSEAPVLTVSLETRGQELLCRSEGIYPQPSVSWSPPSSAARTRVTPSEGGVWSVHSSVSLPHSLPHQHSCNVSNSRGSWRSATYRTNLDIHVSASGETEVPCTKPSAPVKSLIWRFNQYHIILSRSGPEQKNTESWTQFVVGVTESNSLVLEGLSKDQLGLFSCELKTERENFIILTQVTEAETKTKTGGKFLHLWTMGSVLLLIVLLIALLIVVCCRRSQKRRYYMKCIRERFKPPPKTELQPVSWNKLERRNEDGDGPGGEEDGDGPGGEEDGDD